MILLGRNALGLSRVQSRSDHSSLITDYRSLPIESRASRERKRLAFHDQDAGYRAQQSDDLDEGELLTEADPSD